MLTNFLLYFAFYLLTPLLPIYLSEEYGATKDTIGIILSGYTLATLIIRPFSGFLIDNFPRKKILLICLAFFFICFAGYIAASTLLMFGIIRTLHGAPFGASTVSNSTCAIDILPSSRRNEGIGLFGLSNNLAMAISPSIGIYIYKIVGNFNILFWIALFIAGTALITASSIKITTKPIVHQNMKLSLDRFFLTRAWIMAINISLFGFCFGILCNYLAIFSKEELHITTGTGTYFALLSIGLFVSRLQGTKSLKKGKLTHNAGMGMILASVGYLLFVSIHNPIAYYISAILIGLGNGHMYPAFLNMFISIAHHNERGTANSSILTGWDIGFGLGVLLGGIIAEHTSYDVAFWIVAAYNIIGVVLFYTCTRNNFLQINLNSPNH
jgi:predicted MFS family arabinose efflux permease